MNSADEKDNANAPFEKMNPMQEQLPPELRAIRGRKGASSEDSIPDFLKRDRNAVSMSPNPMGGGVPSFEEFKNQMNAGGVFNPFDSETAIEKPLPEKAVPKSQKDSFDDDLGFDVDELVKKIDAKIAELEAEENRQKEEEKKKTAKEDLPAKLDKDEPEKLETEEKSEKLPAKEEKTEKLSDKEEKAAPEVKPASDIHIEEDEDDAFFDDFFDN